MVDGANILQHHDNNIVMMVGIRLLTDFCCVRTGLNDIAFGPGFGVREIFWSSSCVITAGSGAI